MSAPFLSARWINLIIASYEADEALLAPRLPPGLELDRRDGRAFVSLVAFSFLDTRVLGVTWPGHRNFPELNLRTYVRRAGAPDGRRGVLFIREYVPRRAISAVARRCYNEPYFCAPMSMASEGSWDGPSMATSYTISMRSRPMTIAAAGDGPAAVPPPDSTEHWFKEHEWGYGADRAGRLLEYSVRHPAWRTRAVAKCEIDIDWSALYGAEWGRMQGAQPVSVVFAKGSGVTVHRPVAVAPR